MSEQRLDLTNVVTGFEQMRREAVSKGVCSDALAHSGTCGGIADRSLQHAGMSKPAEPAPRRVAAQAGAGKQELPTPVTHSVGCFVPKRVRKLDIAPATRQVAVMQCPHAAALFDQSGA